MSDEPTTEDSRGNSDAEAEAEKFEIIPEAQGRQEMPEESKAGKKYYVLEARHMETKVQEQYGQTIIVMGHKAALEMLGGSWTGHGKMPRGFAKFEEAWEFAANLKSKSGPCKSLTIKWQ